MLESGYEIHEFRSGRMKKQSVNKNCEKRTGEKGIMKSRKFLSMLLGISMMISVTACGNDNTGQMQPAAENAGGIQTPYDAAASAGGRGHHEPDALCGGDQV